MGDGVGEIRVRSWKELSPQLEWNDGKHKVRPCFSKRGEEGEVWQEVGLVLGI